MPIIRLKASKISPIPDCSQGDSKLISISFLLILKKENTRGAKFEINLLLLYPLCLLFVWKFRLGKFPWLLPRRFEIDLDFFSFNFKKGKYTRSGIREQKYQPSLFVFHSSGKMGLHPRCLTKSRKQQASSVYTLGTHTPRYRNEALE